MKNKLVTGLENLDIIIAGTSLFILVGITFIGVIMRYIVGKPFIWQEELQVALFLWVVFFGSSAAFRKNGHIAISMIYDRLPLPYKRINAILVFCVVSVSLLYLGAKGKDMVAMYLRTSKSTSVLSIPSALIYSVVPLCTTLMFINYSFATYRNFPRLKEKEKTS